MTSQTSYWNRLIQPGELWPLLGQAAKRLSFKISRIWKAERSAHRSYDYDSTL